MTRLKHARRQRGHSQHRLARRAGLTQPALSLIERGILIPTPEQLARLSDALDVPAADLLKEVVIVEAVA